MPVSSKAPRRIFVATRSPSDWQAQLADPIKHWKMGYSAMAAAACWEAAKGDLPLEIKRTLEQTKQTPLINVELVAAITEWETPLPGGVNSSCTDVLAITRNQTGVTILAVEAKVDEPFGESLFKKRLNATPGYTERLDFLHAKLGLKDKLEDTIRYQLLHRTVSALLTAEKFHAQAAVMLVHSFSRSARWKEDFLAFCAAVNATPVSQEVMTVPAFSRPALFLAWTQGDPQFLSVDLPSKTLGATDHVSPPSA